MYDYTHHVQRWLNNSDKVHSEAVDLALEALKIACDNESHAPAARANAEEALAGDLRTLVEHGMPVLEGLWADMLRSAVGEIDYEHIAKSFLKELPIWSVFSSDSEDAELFTDLDLAREHLWGKVDADNTLMAGVLRKIENLAAGDSVDIEGTTYQLGRS